MRSAFVSDLVIIAERDELTIFDLVSDDPSGQFQSVEELLLRIHEGNPGRTQKFEVKVQIMTDDRGRSNKGNEVSADLTEIGSIGDHIIRDMVHLRDIFSVMWAGYRSDIPKECRTIA